ncbi:hypothetical protein D3C86_1543220 [compost metagenome]
MVAVVEALEAQAFRISGKGKSVERTDQTPGPRITWHIDCAHINVECHGAGCGSPVATIGFVRRRYSRLRHGADSKGRQDGQMSYRRVHVFFPGYEENIALI